MRNTYIISELFYPNKTSTAYIMTEIAKAISVNKKINVITADITYDKNIDDSKDLNLKNLIIHKTIKVDGNKNSIVTRLMNSIGVALSFGKFLSRKLRKGDTVFAVTNPFLLVIVLGLIRSFKKFKYVLLVHDVFPENAIPAGLMKKTSFQYKFLKLLYDWSYSKADHKIVLGRDMYDLIINKSTKGKVHIIENWFDEDLNPDLNINRNNYLGVDVNDKIVIGFSGNIGRVQNIPKFIELFKKIKNPKLHFIIIGDGAEAEIIKSMISDNDISNITYIGPKPRNEQSLFLNCFDIGLITLSPGMKGLGVPSKTYNLLRMGKPILYIGDKNSEIDILVKENEIGWSTDWEDDNKLINLLNSIDSLNPVWIQNSKTIALNKYHHKIILEKFNTLLND